MSMERHEYVIVGYDLTVFRDKFYTEEWATNEKNIDKWECNQVEGEVQLFSDPCSGSHLYFGYIIHASSEYDEKHTRRYIWDLQHEDKRIVDEKLEELGWDIPRRGILPYELICFTEYR